MTGWLPCLRGDGVKKLSIALVSGWLMAASAGCAPAHQNYARSALAEGRLNDATSEIQLALARHPDDPQVRRLAAQIYAASGAHFYQRKDIDAANRDFRQAIQYDPDYGPAYDYLGQMAFAQGNWASAISYGTQGADLQNRAVPVYVVKARERQRAGSGTAAPQSGTN